MKKRVIRAAAAAAALLILLLVTRRQDPEQTYYIPETVRRGDLKHVMHEMGVFKPREAVLVKTTFPARLQFIVEDGAWVEKGDILFILNEEDELTRVADEHSQLMSLRQELALAEMKRAHAEETEKQKMMTAKRAFDLEKIRYRILTETPTYGDEIIRLHEELKPMEELTAQVRADYEKAQDEFQAARDAEFEYLDALQENRDKIMRAQSRIDALTAAAEANPEKLRASERLDQEDAKKGLESARSELTTLQAVTAGLEKAADEAKQKEEAARGPRDQAAAALAKREESEKEFYIRIEIEKRGLSLTMLRLDEHAARLALDEAKRRSEQGTLSYAAGAISKLALDNLNEELQTNANQYRIIQEKLSIAERPIAPEVLAEGKMKLERAAEAADKAEDTFNRALALQDQEVKVLKAREQKLISSTESRNRRFPGIVESNIQFAEKELEQLGPDEAEKRGKIEADLARLREQLKDSQENPPNIERATVSGIVSVMNNGDRPRQAGDECWEEDTLVEIWPPENMEVSAQVNEVNVKHLENGMPAGIDVPALGNLHCEAEVYQISGIGKDKFFGDWRQGFADVTQFEIRCKLEQTNADFRQGMSVLVSILVGERKNALWLPIGCVRRTGDGWSALVGDEDEPEEASVQGEPFGPDSFIVTGGLNEGDVVYLQRSRNL